MINKEMVGGLTKLQRKYVIVADIVRAHTGTTTRLAFMTVVNPLIDATYVWKAA
jgi:hypothetical protein